MSLFLFLYAVNMSLSGGVKYNILNVYSIQVQSHLQALSVQLLVPVRTPCDVVMFIILHCACALNKSLLSPPPMRADVCLSGPFACDV